MKGVLGEVSILGDLEGNEPSEKMWYHGTLQFRGTEAPIQDSIVLYHQDPSSRSSLFSLTWDDLSQRSINNMKSGPVYFMML